MALCEFLSNAIDFSIRERGDWSGIKIETVDESQVRAKWDHTHVFAPTNSYRSVWEFSFDTYSLQPTNLDSEADQQRQKNWQEAFF